MRIAQVAPIFESVPPRKYGGTERVVSYLTEELVARGHDVTLFASGDSSTRARLVGVTERAVRVDPTMRDDVAVDCVRQLGMVFGQAERFEVIHCHVDYAALPYGALVRTPVVHTLHGRLDLPYLPRVFDQFRDASIVSISDAQRQPLAALDLAWQATIPHGIPVERYRFSPRGSGYLAFLGRIAPEKQPRLAIELAIRAGLPLRIAAKVDPIDRPYFEREVAPLLDHPLVEFIGEIGDDEKGAFLGGAIAVLFPIDWPEPFGLVMIEALACGTPVIARPCGSVPEVLRDGVTGFLAETPDELLEALKRVDTLDRAACRADAERRFSVQRMVDDYEAVYRGLARSARAA